MKAKYALIALLAITFFGCDDNTAGLGLGMFPGSDQNINGKLTTFDVTTKSVHAGEVYAKTSTGYVGKFTDDTFGTYEAGFLSELNCPEGLSFSEMYKENEAGTKATGSLVTSFDNIEIDSKIKDRFTLIKDENNHVIGNCQINIYLWYSSYFGDSLTACRLSIYELDKRLNEEEAYYTNINPEDYYKQSDLLGTKAYTAVDLSVSDSIRKLDTYVPSVSIRLDQAKAEKLGQKLFKADRKDFYKAFPDLFSGIYVKSDYKLLRIALDRILYIEGLKDYIKIHVEDEPKAILSLVSMKAMEEKLPSSRFIRVHRSFIVQKSKIKVLDRGRIVFGKEYIPISDSYKQELQIYLNSHSV